MCHRSSNCDPNFNAYSTALAVAHQIAYTLAKRQPNYTQSVCVSINAAVHFSHTRDSGVK